MSKNSLIVIVLAVVVAVLAALFAKDKLGFISNSESEKMESIEIETENQGQVVEATPSSIPAAENSPSSDTPAVKEFTVLGTADFKFSLNEIKVKKGDRVRIVFKNEGGFHDWVVDEFNAKTKQIPAGQSETIEFIADKTGTFEYYCSVGKHRQMGMKGNLVVE